MNTCCTSRLILLSVPKPCVELGLIIHVAKELKLLLFLYSDLFHDLLCKAVDNCPLTSKGLCSSIIHFLIGCELLDRCGIDHKQVVEHL